VKRLVALLALIGCSSAPNAERVYKANDLQLLTAHAAKEMCSCVFVFGRDETSAAPGSRRRRT
jgi:hypothetical protein